MPAPKKILVHLYGTLESTMNPPVQTWNCFKNYPCILVLSQRQTKGRGTRGRVWLTPQKKPTLSFEQAEDLTQLQPHLWDLFPFTLIIKNYHDWPFFQKKDEELSWQLAQNFHFFCSSFFQSKKFSLKHPNDLMIITSDGKKKVGGLLVEKLYNPPHRFLKIGMGLNGRWFPAEEKATSFEESFGPFSIFKFYETLLSFWERFFLEERKIQRDSRTFEKTQL